MKIQATKTISAVTLSNEDGYTGDFDNTQNSLIGFALLRNDANNSVLYGKSSISLKIDEKVIIPKDTPLSLFQSTANVAPNERFFKFANPIRIDRDKFTLHVFQDGIQLDCIFVFLLDNLPNRTMIRKNDKNKN